MNPVFFNAGKHHFPDIARRIIDYAKSDECKEEYIIERIKGLDGVTDIYVGSLSPQEIENEVFQFIESQGVKDLESYRVYLETKGDIKRFGYYYQYTLSDKTIFTLRLIEDTKYIHIHPARYSPNTFRIRGNTLKTIIITTFLAIRDQKSFSDLNVVNSAREKLGLSPLPEVPSKITSMLCTLQEYV
ncbi:hypothetical protein [Candidatus Uabimicrobium amorphum]|uniref:Uncharacterized protein n=1 Tax=Uabimicrobium amorphum TaxID=2596890 RepID=A0A5S9IPC3_UABAM|nr:hypothetical protein [Candidatus Uabimicrobium amorphum]BBM84710.1 hypothetical protein UABAM_03071 [Candidatus Uabimicrobium amorphum]